MSKITGKRTKDIPDSARKSGISRLIHSPNLLGLCVSSVCCDTLRYSADGETTPQNSLSGYSHSMASVLAFRHSSCTQFSVPPRAEYRQVTPCRVSSALGTKAGTTLKTFFKLRALSFCFCPKGRGGTPLQAQYRRKRPFRNSTALLPASRQLQSQMNQRGRLSCWLKNRRSQLFVVRG